MFRRRQKGMAWVNKTKPKRTDESGKVRKLLEFSGEKFKKANPG